jgi:hypothetical protein
MRSTLIAPLLDLAGLAYPLPFVVGDVGGSNGAYWRVVLAALGLGEV